MPGGHCASPTRGTDRQSVRESLQYCQEIQVLEFPINGGMSDFPNIGSLGLDPETTGDETSNIFFSISVGRNSWSRDRTPHSRATRGEAVEL